MGVVYLGTGWDGTPVAVKVLRPELADDPEFRRRFQREVSALMRVRGFCTVRVIEADTESPQPFMVTEYAEGPSLAEYIDTYGLIGPDMLYGLATGLAEALTVIHAAGIVHRDFKPSNVILTDAGPKVIDFGIAQALDATSMTMTGMMVGSAGFMAPEQISGRPGPAADIFVWTSRDGVTWQRLTAAQLGLQEPGGTPQGIDFAASQGTATVITDRGAGAWLSTDSGAHWTPVTVPVDHGAQNSISGVSFDGAGLVLVRPGRTAGGASDGVAYFSKDGRTWQYAGTIAAAGGWSPDVVKGGDYGFVVTGHTTDQYVAYTSTGTGTKWRPTGPLGSTSSGPGFTPAIGPGGNVIAAGKTNATRTNQQGLLIKADTAGHLEPVSLGSIQGGLIPEEAVNSVAVAGNEQVAVGSADGYPAVWRRVAAGPWSLVSALDQVSASTDLAGLSAVAHGSHGWLAVGPGPLVLTSADGTKWQPAGTITHDLAGVSAVQAASGPHGYVITGTVAEPGGAYSRDLWWSPDLVAWTKASDVNETGGSNRVLAVAAGSSGFVSAGSHENLPVVWTSSDGRTWTAVSTPLPAGATAGVIQQVAVNGSHAVALGQQTTAHGVQPLAERSSDGGRTWQPVPFPAPGPGVSFTALTASGTGFTAAARFGSAGGAMAAAVWTSADGTSWTRSPVSGLSGDGSHAITAIAASGTAVTGIDSVQAQASQQFVVRSLPSG